MSDEGLREIHLNGKQLVFLFMTATVVAVVIFLCGVLVGQGVRAEQTLQAAVTAGSGGDPTVLNTPAVDIVPAPADGTRSPELTFSYPDLLEGQDVPVERLVATPPAATPAPTSSADRTGATPETAKPVPAPPARDRAAASPRNTTSTAAPAAARPAAPTSAPATRTVQAAPRNGAASASAREPAGGGFVVQVAAVRTRTDADGMARRLTAKGYPAFVTTPETGAAQIFRVRVGKYNDRREAESVANRLKKEEQFDPWITR